MIQEKKRFNNIYYISKIKNMELEIKEKFNNFLKIIEKKEKKEKQEYLKQINIPDRFTTNPSVHEEDILKTNTNTNTNTNINTNIIKIQNCECELSSGYSSFYDKNSSELNKKELDIENKENKENKENEEKINYIRNNDNLDLSNLSLLEDDYQMQDKNTKIELKSVHSINSEFKNFFNNIDELKNHKEKSNKNNKLKKKKENSEINNNLEKIYNKILLKNENTHQINNKKNKYDIENYINNDFRDNIGKNNQNKTKEDSKIKVLSELIEYIFIESTRGWDFENNFYILHMDKLKENFKKINFGLNSNLKFGIIYRDFTDTKVHQEKDFTKNWVGYSINSNSNSTLNYTNYNIKNKILYYCLKNLVKSNKFKKKIGQTYYKFIKKTAKIHSYNIQCDIIFFIGIDD